jgi:hypothetical protein
VHSAVLLDASIIAEPLPIRRTRLNMEAGESTIGTRGFAVALWMVMARRTVLPANQPC